MVVAVEVHDTQTAEEAFGSDVVADGVGNADATHGAGTTVVEASKSLKQIFSEGPNFTATEQSGQDQGRIHLSLDFFRKVLITKEVFQSSKRCRSRFDALVNVGVRGERIMDDRAQIFEAFAELYKSRTVDEMESTLLQFWMPRRRGQCAFGGQTCEGEQRCGWSPR